MGPKNVTLIKSLFYELWLIYDNACLGTYDAFVHCSAKKAFIIAYFFKLQFCISLEVSTYLGNKNILLFSSFWCTNGFSVIASLVKIDYQTVFVRIQNKYQ